MKEWGTATQGIRAEEFRTAEGEHSAAIFATSSYVFESAAAAAARFAEEEPGNIYSRFTNPTVAAFEQRLAVMEGGDSCVATASGMAAVLSTCMAMLKAGDHVLAASGLFGSTTSLFTKILAKFGLEFDFVASTDPRAWQAAVRPHTRMLFIESPTNPLTEVLDIAALAEVAHGADAVLVVDNCFCTPALQRPLDLGADIVIHSATKFLDGQGRCVGGAVVGDEQRVGAEVFAFLRTAGPCMSPFNAWVFLKGLETLELRMQAHSANAHKLAVWLQEQPAVERVYYTGLPDHPQHALACRQQCAHGAVVSFDMRGGKAAAWRLIDSTNFLSITANLGDTRTTITHPATTTHHRIGPEARHRAGIGDGLVRIAVGLENIEDIVADLESGLGG